MIDQVNCGGIYRTPPAFGSTYLFKSILGDFSLNWFCNNASSIAMYAKPLTQCFFLKMFNFISMSAKKK